MSFELKLVRVLLCEIHQAFLDLDGHVQRVGTFRDDPAVVGTLQSFAANYLNKKDFYY